MTTKMIEPSAGATLLVNDADVERFKAAGFVLPETKAKATRGRPKKVVEESTEETAE